MVSAKHFFRMAKKNDHNGYLWIPRVLDGKAAWCSASTSSVVVEYYAKSIKGKPEYSREDLLT